MLAASPPLAESAPPAKRTFVPCLRLTMETLTIVGSDARPFERRSPVLSLRFEYGDHIVRASDETPTLARDASGETRAQCTLESFGALDIACLDHVLAPLDSIADYLVHSDDDVHALCSFTAHAVPRLRELGWSVAIDSSYP